MIAFAKRAERSQDAGDVHAGFLAILPRIRRHAWIAFRGFPPEARQELVEEVLANAFVAYVRLVERGKEHLAQSSPLARYAVAQVRVGRRVGGRLNVRDPMSPYCQWRKSLSVGRLDHFDEENNGWQEVVIEDRRAGPAEIACCRIDFASWLRLLPERQRKIALILATGETTSATAAMFGVTAGRISQLRAWFQQTWVAFQGEAVPVGPETAEGEIHRDRRLGPIRSPRVSQLC
jgi:hypothetical protein